MCVYVCLNQISYVDNFGVTVRKKVTIFLGNVEEDAEQKAWPALVTVPKLIGNLRR